MTDLLNDKDKIQRIIYEDQLRRFLKKDLIGLMFPNVRGASQELKDDIRTLALGEISKDIGIEKLKRLKDICEYFISQKSIRRKSYDAPDSKTKIVIDKFTRYEESLAQIEVLLRDA
ncbi:hypothetical protein GQR60_17140 [Labilibaculum sp. A4]|uniref:hypothetical protein n=1 Tax=Labilibaculum euxinus TaxID=2686357 RepID=UPI000F62151B|nr:hypothetical protein [Labilibaculum euxinus]MDQ1772358.1 hypothetical protein [Labilibaculum euxinus]MWN78062.1 hypothetical protein [Labilibaculum euxinus]